MSNIQTIQGTDIISKSYDIINDNFSILESKINSLDLSSSVYEYGIKKVKWNSLQSNFTITLNNGNEIETSSINYANTLRCGLLSTNAQSISGEKIFRTGISIYGTSTQDGHLFIRNLDNSKSLTFVEKSDDIYMYYNNSKYIKMGDLFTYLSRISHDGSFSLS